MTNSRGERMIDLCKHCNGNIEITNPSGYCNHLYYPENCEICQFITNADKLKHDDKWCAYKPMVDELQQKLSIAEKALEHIQTVTAKHNKDLKSLISGAVKMEDYDLIEYAKDVDVLASLVYGFAEEALAKMRGGEKG